MFNFYSEFFVGLILFIYLLLFFWFLGQFVAALLLQGSIQVYSRKVEYLHSLVLHALEFISQKRFDFWLILFYLV